MKQHKELNSVLTILLFGIILFSGSTYLNILKEHSADIGVYLSVIIIVVSILASIANWFIK